MIYNYKEIIYILKSDFNLNKKLKNKELFKIEKGIYSDKKVVDPILVYTKKYSNSIVTLDNIFYIMD